ncbi:MAG: SMC-Scp complex subunit ScpB [Oscillospiraceae bacterium]|nr:SMC-Scp complex subunit ScpB [Oscillospiraceae bacterium]
MINDENLSAAEAVLFAYGEPIKGELLASVCSIDKQSVPQLIHKLNERYEKYDSALEVLKLDDSYQLATRKKYAESIRSALETGRTAALSAAAMECLAIIAYNQPVTRSFVENVRGIDSSSVMNKLVERGLIEEAERLDVPGRPISYRTTNNFLRCFSLSSLDDLPDIAGQGDTDLFSSVRTDTQEK